MKAANRLKAVDDQVAGQNDLGDYHDNGLYYSQHQTAEFAYDDNGNLEQDMNRNIGIKYGILHNLPIYIAYRQTGGGGSIATLDVSSSTVDLSDRAASTSYSGSMMNYYTLQGRKMAKKVYNDQHTLTLNESYYDELMLSHRQPARISHADGYVSLDENGEATFYYYLTDHLGNIRSVITPDADGKPQVEQANDYFPFGMSFESKLPLLTKSGSGNNKLKYNGKEEQEMPGKWLDYGARFYDAQLGRWHGVDPAAALYFSLSPFQYGGNSPINTIDIGGKLFVYVNGFMLDHWWAGMQSEKVFSTQGSISNPNYSKYAPDRNFYTDGPRNNGEVFNNDYWNGIPERFGDIFKDPHKIFTNGSFTPASSGQERFGMGYANAQKLIEKLKNGDIKLEEGETIKIVGHSQGAAYAAGIATALLEHSTYKHLVEFVVYLAPDQPNQFRHPFGVPGYQFSTHSDWVSSTGILAWLRNSSFSQIDGATWMQERGDYKGSRGGHGTDSWVNDIIQWAMSYGIPITVHE
ncbi:MAG: hypothetical protein KJ578_09230 [Bacteroidetes bacterium]|nr:hypothetical protein [Bacteroidota bacterium]MBU1580515.1 hypothetical protein [Bacteroidota bacterium]MBU2466992.1 hypothetical protein [Bacteroidota bacterium]MBU2557944.1 hypothetical protein [Bacteroidota bacterium]